MKSQISLQSLSVIIQEIANEIDGKDEKVSINEALTKISVPIDEEEEESEHEELPSDFECDEEDVHQTCGKTFIECECSFIRILTCVYRGKETQYACTCHPLFEDCECFYDQVYDPEGLME